MIKSPKRVYKDSFVPSLDQSNVYLFREGSGLHHYVGPMWEVRVVLTVETGHPQDAHEFLVLCFDVHGSLSVEADTYHR